MDEGKKNGMRKRADGEPNKAAKSKLFIRHLRPAAQRKNLGSQATRSLATTFLPFFLILNQPRGIRAGSPPAVVPPTEPASPLLFFQDTPLNPPTPGSIAPYRVMQKWSSFFNFILQDKMLAMATALVSPSLGIIVLKVIPIPGLESFCIDRSIIIIISLLLLGLFSSTR